MPNINFYLKDPQGWNPEPINQKEKKTDKPKKKKTDDATIILLQMKYNGQRLVYSIGESIKPGQWNFNKQRVKNITATTKDGKHNLNDLLKNLEQVCDNAYNKEIKNGTPAPETLKKYLEDFVNPPVKKKTTLLSFIEEYMKESAGQKKPNTIKKYGTLLTHLKDYNKNLTFSDIDLNFFYIYVRFLKDKWSLSQNSIAKDIAVLKTLLNEAADRDLHENMKFKKRKFSYGYVDVQSVSLSENEIRKLYRFKLSYNKKLEQIRDLFIVGCRTGLRFGDYSNLKPQNIKGKFIEIFSTEKTGEPVVVPLHQDVEEIYKKYNGFPKKVSVQKFNQYLKEVCELAGFNDKGRIENAPDEPLYSFITSHTARRSFATNLYLEGFPVIDLMKITGHRTERAFLKYVKVSKHQAAERLAAHINMKKMQAV